jgi:hypothetical protein
MQKEFTITYKAENHYENWVHDAYWQFLILPEENETQQLLEVHFSNSLHATNEFSINGYGFNTVKVHPKQQFKEISFEAIFKLSKSEVNPFDFESDLNHSKGFKQLGELEFKVGYSSYLKQTALTKITDSTSLFQFNQEKSIFQNLQELNHWVYLFLHFTVGVTDTSTTLEEVLDLKKGVCQDFTHLFCAIAKENNVPARYVSGYLNQGNGYFGDSQMHAWAEAYVPFVGWMAFDPTNNLLANTNHIKVCHGKDYDDCAPLKGVVYTEGSNKTSHLVTVTNQQQ